MKHKNKSHMNLFLALCMILALIPNHVTAQEPSDGKIAVEIPTGANLTFTEEKQVGIQENDAYTFSQREPEPTPKEEKNTAIYVGNYRTTLKLNPNYKWKVDPPTNNTEDKEVNWSINPATQTLSTTSQAKNVVYKSDPYLEITNWVTSNIPGSKISYKIKETTNKISILPNQANTGYLLIIGDVTKGEKYTIVATAAEIDRNSDGNAEYSETTLEFQIEIKEKAKKYMKVSQTDSQIKFGKSTTITAELYDDENFNTKSNIPDKHEWRWEIKEVNQNLSNLEFTKSLNENSFTFEVKKINDFNAERDFLIDLEYEDNLTFVKMDTITREAIRGDREKPSNLEAIRPSSNNNDGQIKNTDTTMEYKKDGASNYQTCSDSATPNLSAGTYFVRYKQTHQYNASPDAEITIPEYNAVTKIDRPSGETFTYDGQEKTAFTVDSAAGYTLITDDEHKNTATDAGNYKVKFRLKHNYQWKDGSTDDAVVNWKITKASQAAIAAPELSFSKNADNKTFTATIKKVDGAEYSFDGTHYSATNTKSDCQPDTNITAYIRKKADDNHEAGAASNTTKKSPKILSNSGNSNSSGSSSNSESSNSSDNTSNVTSSKTLISSEKQQKEVLSNLTKNAKSGETLNLRLDNKAKLFAKSLEQVAGKDVIIQLRTGKVTWEINAKNLPENADLKDLNLGVKLNSNSIPQSAIKESFGEQKPIQMEIAHDGEFGFTMNLNVNVGAKNQNLFANIYYYNPITKKNEFKSAHKIDKKGNISIPFNHASSYAILVDKTAHSAKKEVNPNEAKQVYENKFEDVKSSDWFYDAVAYMAQNQFMSGVSQTSFEPDTRTSRAMIATILHRAAGAPKAMSTHSFKDVEMGAYYEEALSWASENKIINGYDKDTFAPNDAITREQFALILMNFAKSRDIEIKMGTKQLTFEDLDQISSWAKDALTWANTSKIINGDGRNLNPKQNATRAQSAMMIMNFMQNFFEEAVPYHN